jgi:serine/threonine protein kinase
LFAIKENGKEAELLPKQYIKTVAANCSKIMIRTKFEMTTSKTLTLPLPVGKTLSRANFRRNTTTSDLRKQRREKFRKSMVIKMNSVVGSPHYMAPEVISGETYDESVDWWSIGCILYETLYGNLILC